MRFVAIADEVVSEIDESGLRLRIPQKLSVGDVVCIQLNSASFDPDGNERKECRIYTLPPDPAKIPPRYHLGTELRGDLAFEISDFGLYLYTTEPEIPFMRLRILLNADEVDVLEVFAEFDKQIYRLNKENRILLNDVEIAERLYERAAKCKARLFGTSYANEAETAFVKAVQLMAKIIGLEVDEDAKPCD
jgi:hypothetical protein